MNDAYIRSAEAQDLLTNAYEKFSKDDFTNAERNDLREAVKLSILLTELAATLSLFRSDVDNAIGEQMGRKRVVLEDVGAVERNRNKSRRNWQSDDLLRLVLDSRIVNPETGEVESQVQALKAVYGLAGYTARMGALRDRGIDPDEYAETEDRGWSIRIY